MVYMTAAQVIVSNLASTLEAMADIIYSRLMVVYIFCSNGFDGLQAHGQGGFGGFCQVFYAAIEDKLNQ